ncbi:hypothetical protein BCT41_20600 [Vibrio splendidus]|nr:hypothetical protein BCT41_20600 [Vibrio splendidus]
MFVSAFCPVEVYSLVLLAQLMNKKPKPNRFGFFVPESEFKVMFSVWFVLNMVLSDGLSL